jgi:hypothetical protein
MMLGVSTIRLGRDSLVVVVSVTSRRAEANERSVGKDGVGNVEALDPLVPLGDVQVELEPVALEVGETALGRNRALPEVLL